MTARFVPLLLSLCATTAAGAWPIGALPGDEAPQGPPRPRARELGLAAAIGGTPGPIDAITDVAGVEVGHTTLISGEGPLVVGRGPVRTGVTVVHPRGKARPDPVFGAWFTLNGNGESTGTTWLEESGIIEGPVAVTNPHSVGVVRDAMRNDIFDARPNFLLPTQDKPPFRRNQFGASGSGRPGHHPRALQRAQPHIFLGRLRRAA